MVKHGLDKKEKRFDMERLRRHHNSYVNNHSSSIHNIRVDFTDYGNNPQVGRGEGLKLHWYAGNPLTAPNRPQVLSPS